MSMLFRRIFFLFTTVTALHGQWPAYPTVGIPRMPDGKPNLDGPTPKTIDGHPDLSGIWDFRNPTGTANANASTRAEVAGAPQNERVSFGQTYAPGEIAQFWNIGSSLEGGLPFRPQAEQVRAARRGENSKDNPDARCLPISLTQLHTHNQPRKVVQTPNVIVIINEANSGLRQIFTDGRRLPGADVAPWWYGYSVGHWEGDTLAVETTGFRDDVWLDYEGSPLTSAGKVTERFRRPNYGNLEIEVTVDDPKSYTKPWTVKINQRILPDTELIEFVCNENNRDAGHLVGK
jgi:hypothetical protein